MSKQKFEIGDLVILTENNKRYTRNTYGFYHEDRPDPRRGRKGQVARIHAYNPNGSPCYKIILLHPQSDQTVFAKPIGSNKLKKI